MSFFNNQVHSGKSVNRKEYKDQSFVVSVYQDSHKLRPHLQSEHAWLYNDITKEKQKKTEGLFYVSPHLDAPELDCISSRNVWTTFGRLNVQSWKDDGIAL